MFKFTNIGFCANQMIFNLFVFSGKIFVLLLQSGFLFIHLLGCSLLYRGCWWYIFEFCLQNLYLPNSFSLLCLKVIILFDITLKLSLCLNWFITGRRRSARLAILHSLNNFFKLTYSLLKLTTFILANFKIFFKHVNQSKFFR